MPRYALAVEYDGTEYSGWQIQSHVLSLQQCLEQALSKVADHRVEVVCAGRTDAGVHASGQVVHFDSTAIREPRSWILGANANLPKAMSVYWAAEMPETFHARYSALAREYRYSLLNRPARAGLGARFLAWERAPLDLSKMQQAAQHLIGDHDFTSFRTVACQAKRPWRRLDRLEISRQGDICYFVLQANAFLHHMVRNIVGSLMVVGRGVEPPDWIAQILAARDRSLAGATAPAGGLEFLGPKYPARLGLPPQFHADPVLELWDPTSLHEPRE